MDHLQMFVKNDGTNENIQAADRVLVAHRYNCSDSPSTWPERNHMRIVQQLDYHQAGKSSHSSPTEDASNLFSLCVYHNIQNGIGKP